jgi:hypothetical protein
MRTIREDGKDAKDEKDARENCYSVSHERKTL